MTFTDEELKRLKERATNHNFMANALMSREHFESLLARLEAAENVCEKASNIIGGISIRSDNELANEYAQAKQVWHKRAGK